MLAVPAVARAQVLRERARLLDGDEVEAPLDQRAQVGVGAAQHDVCLEEGVQRAVPAHRRHAERRRRLAGRSELGELSEPLVQGGQQRAVQVPPPRRQLRRLSQLARASVPCAPAGGAHQRPQRQRGKVRLRRGGGSAAADHRRRELLHRLLQLCALPLLDRRPERVARRAVAGSEQGSVHRRRGEAQHVLAPLERGAGGNGGRAGGGGPSRVATARERE
mmetsp:Transcript_14206/g.45509  ORF Transcript_14206/g.45509 Transcript_14206/m.45509 type:complete len:220 (-) Transcript_14206:996-1655(-)